MKRPVIAKNERVYVPSARVEKRKRTSCPPMGVTSGLFVCPDGEFRERLGPSQSSADERPESRWLSCISPDVLVGQVHDCLRCRALIKSKLMQFLREMEFRTGSKFVIFHRGLFMFDLRAKLGVASGMSLRFSVTARPDIAAAQDSTRR